MSAMPMSRAKAAEYLRNTYGVRISYRYLCKLASLGGGPRYSKSGDSVTYTQADLDAWQAARTIHGVTSTAEYPQTPNLREGGHHA